MKRRDMLLAGAVTVILLARCASPIVPPEGEDSRDSSGRRACEPVPAQSKQRGTQGYRIWTGETLRSFEHEGTAVCVPDGWEPVGESEAGDGWAVFPAGQTGVFVRSDAFGSRVARFDNTRFDVEIVWPKSMARIPKAATDALIEWAFVHVGALYPDFPQELATPHTVLVSAGVAGGSTRDYEGRIYPEPGPNLSVVVRTPEQWRAHELFIHAVAHLYNRHRTHWHGDQKEKLPIPEEDWQELVATWTETAFIRMPSARIHRLRYIHSVHRAVREHDFSLIQGPPFDRRAEFERIHPGVVVPQNSPDLDFQYGHYILGPLTMVGTEGLLIELAATGTIPATSVATLLTEVNRGEHDSYFAALEEILPPAEMERIRDWMAGRATVPWELVERAATHYDDELGSKRR